MPSRRRFASLLLFLVIAFPAVSRSQAASFSDFRIPSHRWYSLTASINAYGSRQSVPDGRRWSRTLQGDLRGAWMREADHGSTRFDGWLAANEWRQGENSRSREADLFLRDRASQRTDRWSVGQAGLRAQLVHYGLPLALGARWSGLATIDDAQQRSERVVDALRVDTSMARSVYRSSFRSTSYVRRIEGSVAIGWGKVRNATGVLDAAVLEKRLLERGVLARPLGAETRRRIARLYYLEPLYGIAHDRPSKFFWQDLERILLEAGILDEKGWAAFDLMRAAEGYRVPGAAGKVIRRRGWFIGPSYTASVGRSGRSTRFHDRGFQLISDSLSAEWDYSSGHRQASSGDEVLPGAEAELHWPLGLGCQIDLAASARTPAKEFGDLFHVQSSASFSWFLADRWGLHADTWHERAVSSAGGYGPESSWHVTYQASLGFLIEDHVTLGVRARETQTSYRTPIDRPRFQRDGQVSLTLSYRFLGALDSPRLIEPVRPLPISETEPGW